MGFTYPPIIGDSTLYNPRFYPSIGADGVLTFDFAQTLYLSKNDFRLSYLSGVIPGTATSGSALVLNETLSLSGLGSISCSALTVGGVAVGTLPSFLTGITPGMAANNKAMVLDGSGAIATIASLTATNINATHYLLILEELQSCISDLISNQLVNYCSTFEPHKEPWIL
jgi:hypothetical protein